MSTKNIADTRTQLYHWIDKLPPYQLELIYRLVEALVGEHPLNETDYLLSSDTMKARLLAARESSEGIPFEVVREKLGI